MMTDPKCKTRASLSPHGWTIDTLKELMDEKFSALRSELIVRDHAIDMQAVENKRRLEELNHVHARTQQIQETYVSKDSWDGHMKTDHTWKTTTDRVLQNALPRSEFQAYKDSTEKTLTLMTGHSQGIGSIGFLIFQVIAAGASIGSMIGMVLLLMRKG